MPPRSHAQNACVTDLGVAGLLRSFAE